MIDLSSTSSLIEAVDVEMENSAPDFKLAPRHIDRVAFDSNGASIRLISTPAQTKSPHHEVNRATDHRNVAAEDLKTPPLHPR